jgi:hypothetical protein
MQPDRVTREAVRQTFTKRGDGIDLRSTKGKLFLNHLLTLIDLMPRVPSEDDLVALRAIVFQTLNLRAMEQHSFDSGEPLTQVYINLTAQLERGLRSLGIETNPAPRRDNVASV